MSSWKREEGRERREGGREGGREGEGGGGMEEGEEREGGNRSEDRDACRLTRTVACTYVHAYSIKWRHEKGNE